MRGVKLIKFANKLLLDTKCNSIIRCFPKPDNIEEWWIILEDDNFENNMKFVELIEEFISNNNVKIDYLFFDKTQKDGLINYFSQRNDTILEVAEKE
jgi:hypothetical protein